MKVGLIAQAAGPAAPAARDLWECYPFAGWLVPPPDGGGGLGVAADEYDRAEAANRRIYPMAGCQGMAKRFVAEMDVVVGLYRVWPKVAFLYAREGGKKTVLLHLPWGKIDRTLAWYRDAEVIVYSTAADKKALAAAGLGAKAVAFPQDGGEFWSLLTS